jgi:hypothetical protein
VFRQSDSSQQELTQSEGRIGEQDSGLSDRCKDDDAFDQYSRFVYSNHPNRSKSLTLT